MNPAAESTNALPEDSGLKQRQQRQRTIIWFLIAVFTVICASIPLFMQGKAGSATWVTIMLACGATLGGMTHRRPWRFGLVLSAVFIVEAIIIGGANSIFELLDKIRFGVTIAIPAFIGAYGGAFVRKLVKHHIHLTGEPENLRYWKAAVAFGAAAGVLTILTGTVDDVPYASMLLLFSASVAISYLKPERLWRWVIAMSPGLPLAVILRIAFDLSRYPDSHDLYPLEIGISIIYAVVPVLGGVITGRLIKTGSIARPPTDYPSYGQDVNS